MNLVYFREVVFMKIFILPVCFSAKPLFFPLYTPPSFTPQTVASCDR